MKKLMKKQMNKHMFITPNNIAVTTNISNKIFELHLYDLNNTNNNAVFVYEITRNMITIITWNFGEEIKKIKTLIYIEKHIKEIIKKNRSNYLIYIELRKMYLKEYIELIIPKLADRFDLDDKSFNALILSSDIKGHIDYHFEEYITCEIEDVISEIISYIEFSYSEEIKTETEERIRDGAFMIIDNIAMRTYADFYCCYLDVYDLTNLKHKAKFIKNRFTNTFKLIENTFWVGIRKRKMLRIVESNKEELSHQLKLQQDIVSKIGTWGIKQVLKK